MGEWASVEELLSAQSGVHESEVSVYGKKFKIYWAELINSEFPSIIPPNVEKMNDKEKMAFLSKMNEEITLSMIEKGQKMKEAEVGELKFKITSDSFNKLIPRIRSDIIASVWQVREENNLNL